MDYIFLIAITILTALSQFSIIHIVLGRQYRKKIGIGKTLILALQLLWLIPVLLLGNNFSFITGHIWAFTAACVVLDMRFTEVAKYYVISFFAFELYCNSMETMLVLVFMTDFSREICQIIYLTVLLSIIWIFFFLRRRNWNWNSLALYGVVWIPVLSIEIFLYGMFSYYNYLVRHLEEKFLSIGVVFSGFGALLIDVCIFIFIYLVNKEYNLRVGLAVNNEFNNQQKEYFEELSKRDRQNRKLLHDRKAELLLIENYIENENYNALREYVCELEDSENCRVNKGYNVGNDIVNVILNYYLGKLGDDTSVAVRGMVSEKLPLSRVDLCIIISNIVRNSVEELQETDQKKIYEFEIWEKNRELQIRSRNSCRAFDATRQKEYRKNGTHYGIGISSIIESVEKYGGVYNSKLADAFYTTTVIIPLTEKNDHLQTLY